MCTKEFLTTSLERLKAHREKGDALYKLGVNLIDYDSPLETGLVQAMAMVVARGDEEYKYALNTLEWWLYERAPKRVWEADGTERNLTEMGDFVDYLIETYN